MDRAEFPSDTPSTHAIQPAGVQLLDQLGTVPSLRSRGASINRGILRWGTTHLELSDLAARFGAPMVNLRRVVLDAELVNGAAAAGADVRTATVVTGLVREGDRVTGVTTNRGSLRARLVVGADGARSTVARLVAAGEYGCTWPSRVFLWSYYAGVQADPSCVWLGLGGDDRYAASCTDDGLFVALVAPPRRGWSDGRTDRTSEFDAGLRRWPELAARLDPASRVGGVRVMSTWRGFFRQATGPGWVLVGDAGHFKDPTAAQGISDALRQVFALARAIEDALSDGDGARPLRDWWRWRDHDAWEMYWFAHDLGAVHQSSVLSRLLQRRLAEDPAFLFRAIQVLNRDVRPSDLLSAPEALSIVTRALRDDAEDCRAILTETLAAVAGQFRRRAMYAASAAQVRLGVVPLGGRIGSR
jgi:2-polyprenyl-6-methoxyphenol hydroxylase-like FAD-dependent oxidoreductase